MGLLDKAGGASNTTEVKPKAKAKAVAKAKPVAKASRQNQQLQLQKSLSQKPLSRRKKGKQELQDQAVYPKDSKFQINWIVP